MPCSCVNTFAYTEESPVMNEGSSKRDIECAPSFIDPTSKFERPLRMTPIFGVERTCADY